ncbi:MAG: hypothetical protein ACE5HV_01795 [Acidobacteriota bacterium]
MCSKPVTPLLFHRFTTLVVLGTCVLTGRAWASKPAGRQADGKAVEIAERVLEQMGGRESWNQTRYISWKFMGRRTHYWDKWTGNDRIESDNRVTLFNVHTRKGRVWEDGHEITEPSALAEALDRAYGAWINDTYWMFMPYKLLDPGVTLEYRGQGTMADGRDADILQLTFDKVGRTPDNRYFVYVARDTGLVEQWSYFRNASDQEPGFTLPWAGWRRFGKIMLATGHGRDRDWQIGVYEDLPPSTFTSPDPLHPRDTSPDARQ